MSRKVTILRYLYDLFTGKHLRDLQNLANKQDDEIKTMIATMNGDPHWMLEIKEQDNNHKQSE